MSRIRAKNTKPEMLVRKFLHAQGFRYTLHNKNLTGKPDIVLPKYKRSSLFMAVSGMDIKIVNILLFQKQEQNSG